MAFGNGRWHWCKLRAVYTDSTTPHEIKLVEETLLVRFTDEQPAKLNGDKAYDSDTLDEQLARFETGLIAPHKANRKKVKNRMDENSAATNAAGK